MAEDTKQEVKKDEDDDDDEEETKKARDAEDLQIRDVQYKLEKLVSWIFTVIFG